MAQIDQSTIEIPSTVTTNTTFLKNILDFVYANSNLKNMKAFVMRAHWASHDNYIVVGQKDANGVTCMVANAGYIFMVSKGGSTYYYRQATLTVVS